MKNINYLVYTVVLCCYDNMVSYAQSTPDSTKMAIDSIAKEKEPLKVLPDAYIGPWTANFHGWINTRYQMTTVGGDDQAAIDGALMMASQTFDEKPVHSISNGYAISCLFFNMNRVLSDGTELNVIIDFFFGLNSNEAFENTAIDMRQVHFTFGNKRWGTFKFGRAYNPWTMDAYMNDISGLGSGLALSPTSPGFSTLGGIGAGYPFGDRTVQMGYTTPEYKGFSVEVAAYSPLDFAAITDHSYTGETQSLSPGFHGKIRYNHKFSTNTSLYVSPGVTGQSNQLETKKLTTIGYDIFARLKISDLELGGYYYGGSGIGNLGYMLDAADLSGEARKSNGGFAQATYYFGKGKLNSVGIKYGTSMMDKTGNDPLTLLKSAEHATILVKRKLWDSMFVSADYSHSRATNNQSETLYNNIVSIGAILMY